MERLNFMNRIFFAIKVTSEVREMFQKHVQNYEEIEGIKVEKDFHLTVKFVGEVTDEKLNKIINHFKEFKYWRFSVTITKTESFPSMHKPGYIIAALKHSEHLINLKRVFEEYMFKFFEKDGKIFRPHITLVRNKAMMPYEFINTQKKFEHVLLKYPFEIDKML
jgi:2'-5' RNA ligase